MVLRILGWALERCMLWFRQNRVGPVPAEWTPPRAAVFAPIRPAPEGASKPLEWIC